MIPVISPNYFMQKASYMQAKLIADTIKYIISSKKYGTLIHLFPENSYTLKETIASRAGLGLIALGTLEMIWKTRCQNLKDSNIYDILPVMLFIYLIIFPIIKSDESGGYS